MKTEKYWRICFPGNGRHHGSISTQQGIIAYLTRFYCMEGGRLKIMNNAPQILEGPSGRPWATREALGAAKIHNPMG